MTQSAISGLFDGGYTQPQDVGVTGIQDPMLFSSPLSQKGYSSAYTTPISSAGNQQSSIDLQKELATIQAMKQPQGGGIGQTIGGGAGAGLGMALTGGNPLGAAAGQVAGSTIGSVVDYIIDSDDKKKAERKREQALIREAERQKKIKASEDNIRALAQRRGIALSREEEAMSEQDVINQMRRSTMSRVLSMINQKAQQDEYLKNKFLKSRRVG